MYETVEAFSLFLGKPIFSYPGNYVISLNQKIFKLSIHKIFFLLHIPFGILVLRYINVPRPVVALSLPRNPSGISCFHAIITRGSVIWACILNTPSPSAVDTEEGERKN